MGWGHARHGTAWHGRFASRWPHGAAPRGAKARPPPLPWTRGAAQQGGQPVASALASSRLGPAGLAGLAVVAVVTHTPTATPLPPTTSVRPSSRAVGVWDPLGTRRRRWRGGERVWWGTVRWGGAGGVGAVESNRSCCGRSSSFLCTAMHCYAYKCASTASALLLTLAYAPLSYFANFSKFTDSPHIF